MYKLLSDDDVSAMLKRAGVKASARTVQRWRLSGKAVFGLRAVQVGDRGLWVEVDESIDDEPTADH